MDKSRYSADRAPPRPSSPEGEEGLDAGGAGLGNQEVQRRLFGSAHPLAGAMGGTPQPVPHRAEMERLFGVDLSRVVAYTGAGEALRGMGASAAAADGVLAFADPHPAAEQVAEEVAHLAQGLLGGGGAGDVSDPTDSAEREAKSAARGALAGRAQRVTRRPTAAVMRDADDRWHEARTRAAAIHEAFHGSIWGQDEARALGQITGVSTLMVREIRAQYRERYDLRLEDEFRRHCDRAQHQSALAHLWGALSLHDRVRTNVEPGWLWDSANEQGILDVLRSASDAERHEGGRSEGLMTLLRRHLDDQEYFEARRLLQPDRLYDIVVERIRGADGFFGDDEGAAYDAILELPVAERRRLWEENAEVFAWLDGGERARARRMCLGTEAEALEARMAEATEGWGTDDAAVAALAGRTRALGREEATLRAAVQSGGLPEAERAAAEARLAELGGVGGLLGVERDAAGGVKEGTFLGMLRGDVSEEEYRRYLETMGGSAFEVARQQILDAVGFWSDDETAIWEAFDRVADPELRRRLWDDPQVQAALGQLRASERSTAAAFRDGDGVRMALARLEDAWERIDADEGRIFELLEGLDAGQRAEVAASSLYARMLRGMGERHRRALVTVVETGRLPTELAVDTALGGGWDGTDEALLGRAFERMGDEERFRHRLGYWLSREGRQPEGEEEVAALRAFRELEARLGEELGSDDLQAALTALIGVASSPRGPCAARSTGCSRAWSASWS